MVPIYTWLVLFLLSHQAYAAAPDFNRDVAPLLVKRCLECHNKRQKAGGLVLTTAQLAMRGGESGRAILPGKASASHLIERIQAGEMPPAKRGKPQPLPAKEVRILQAWIEAGAKWPAGRTLDVYEATNDVRAGRDFWSLQPVKRPPVPKLSQHPVDSFVLRRLAQNKLSRAPLADKRTLIRRLYVDLIGLPPTYKEIEAFVSDKSPRAWEKVADRLLKSPHYGERWARYWLDLVRFAETCGYERDQVKPYAWRYRDWVVQAFNEDKPYDEFVREQIAGDEIAKSNEQSVIATGFLRLGTWNDEPNDPHEYKYERLEDMVHATSSAFLALTVKCARCHDHKFDPILQQDYYRMASAFWAGPIDPSKTSRSLLGGPTAKQLGYTNVFGWTDTGRTPDPFHLLKKGDPKKPGPLVKPTHLSTIPYLNRKFLAPPAKSKTSRRRLQLAQWITDRRNPLIARVLVNRLWLHHFGQGLVRTPNNFGFRGDRPTHPQLLDWLASEFVSGGWKIKRMHKLIVTSYAYRQSVLHPRQDQYRLRDSSNKLWWRANRRRLDAEALRDAMLASSGELDLKLGGPSFRPTISPEALEGLSRKQSAWVASPFDQQRRRSLYIFTKRGLLPPLMTTFDFSDTTLPCGQRNSTTVAPQALAMLNNHFTHRQSRAMARRVIKESGKSPAKRITRTWELAYGRRPSAVETQLAQEHLQRQSARFDPQTRLKKQKTAPSYKKLPVTRGLVLHLRADQGIQLDGQGRVESWRDLSVQRHDGRQKKPSSRPLLVPQGMNGRATLRFDGRARFLQLRGKLLGSVHTSMFAVTTDMGGSGHREILSNWAFNNSTTSIFLGLTGKATVRFSDLFRGGPILKRRKPFVLTATHGSAGAAIFQNTRRIAGAGPFASRNLTTPWVVGQQGNINGEYWNGDIAEIVVFDRELAAEERVEVWAYLMTRYKINQLPVDRATPVELALASLCHVLLNSNEFMYVD